MLFYIERTMRTWWRAGLWDDSPTENKNDNVQQDGVQHTLQSFSDLTRRQLQLGELVFFAVHASFVRTCTNQLENAAMQLLFRFNNKEAAQQDGLERTSKHTVRLLVVSYLVPVPSTSTVVCMETKLSCALTFSFRTFPKSYCEFNSIQCISGFVFRRKAFRSVHFCFLDGASHSSLTHPSPW